MRPYPRTRQIDETLKEVIASILATEVGDPRLEFVTITGVRATPDLRVAHVYATAHGSGERYAAMLEGFDAARGRIRSLVAERLPTKVTPELIFEVDQSVDEGARIDHALRAEAKAERKLARYRDWHADERAESYAGTAAQGPTAQAATYATPDAAAPDTAHGAAADPAAPSDAGEAS